MFIRESDDDGARRRFSRRAMILALGQFGLFGVLAGRLYQLQVLEGRRYALLADDNRINVQITAPERGRILARSGEVVAANVPVHRVSLVPALAGEPKVVMARLARILGLPEDEQERLLARLRRQPRAMPLIIASDLTFEQVAEISLFAPHLPGVQTDVMHRRAYPAGAVLGHVLGHVGAPERIGLDDDPVLRLPGMRTGKAGVERALEVELRGKGGIVRHEVDARGQIIRALSTIEPRRGSDVVLSIDVSVQERVARRLARERRAAVAALSVDTGEVMALASHPVFDPADVVGGGAALASLQSNPDEALLSRATQGLYPPGSTFKMVTALAGLETGLLSPGEEIECEGAVTVAGQTFRCWKRSGHGACDLHRALRESCDVYFYEAARRAGIEAIALAGQQLGLGRQYAGGIGPQRAGILPNANWKRGRFGKPWYLGETLLAGIGQGFVLTTPLQLAVMTARLASGRSVEPILARAVRDPAPAQFAPLGFKPAQLDAIRNGMIAAVNEASGTGRNALLEEDLGRLAGKTGTSQVNRASTDRSQSDLKWEERDHALFVAYAPVERPRYAVAVVVEHGGSGGGTAAPIAKDVMELLLTADPAAKPFGPGVGGVSERQSRRRGGAG